MKKEAEEVSLRCGCTHAIKHSKMSADTGYTIQGIRALVRRYIKQGSDT
jgi:hypothetical protein